MITFRLASTHLRARPVRTALTVAAIALAVSLVVSVTSGYSSLEAAAYRMLSTYFANVDARLTHASEAHAGVDERWIQQIAADPDVASAVGRIELSSSLVDQAGRTVMSRSAMLVGVTRPQDKRVELMELTDGAWFDSSEGNVAVIDQMTAMLLHDGANLLGDEDKGAVKVGEVIRLPGPTGDLTVRVVGIVHKPRILAALQPSIYLPIRTLQNWSGSAGKGMVSSILIDLKPQANPTEFGRRWRAKLAQVDPLLKLRLTSEDRGELDRNLGSLRIGSYMGGAVSMLAATFIIFSALSMGVSERQRTLAMLRAVGASRRQLGAMVTQEAVLLAAGGIVLGIPLGWLWLQILDLGFDDLLVAGIVMDRSGIGFAAAAALAAALVASILPAWGAMKTDPLEAMAPLAAGGSLRRALSCAVPGVLLISIDSLIVFSPWRQLFQGLGIPQAERLAREVAFYGHFAVGIPALMLGFFLLAPTMVVLVEKLLAPLAATATRLRLPLLRQQLSGGVWRSAGTAAALMVGLAILVVMQVQGHTVIGSWRIPDKFPDMFITTFKFGGLSTQDIEKIRGVEGVKQDAVLPIAIASPEFGSTIFSIRGAVVMPEATMFFGVDPKLALEMMELDFRDGSRSQAIELMTSHRRHVLVTEEFRQLKGLKTGDTITLKTPRGGTAEYTIAGVVWSPGIDVIVSMFDLGRQFETRTAASIFGTLQDARDDFGVEGVYLLALNVQPGVQREVLTEAIKAKVGAWGLQAGDVRVVKSQIQHQFRKILMLVSTVGFSAMAVASLGVANTVMASVRTRRWQFGILRSVGLTRGQLLRLVLSEALLLGAAGVCLGLLAGAVMAINAKRNLLVMVGLDPPFTIPWGMIGAGVASVVAISLLAGLWPAVTVARCQPLALLQAGRSSD
ncbi:MAG: FtsX-like permease family protein [Phycisphaerae bacterium]|nr:FtsX-like permease family protein [Phycisphaerae bacterium]